MSPPVGGGCPRGSRRGVPGGSRGGPGGGPGGAPRGGPRGGPRSWPGAGRGARGARGAPGGLRRGSAPETPILAILGGFRPPKKTFTYGKGGFWGVPGGPSGGVSWGVDPVPTPKIPKIRKIHSVPTGRVIKYPRKCTPPGPGGPPGVPPGAPPAPTSPRGCPPRPPESTRGGSVSRPHPVGSVSDPLTLGPLALRVSPGGSSQTPMPPAMGPLAPPS